MKDKMIVYGVLLLALTSFLILNYYPPETLERLGHIEIFGIKFEHEYFGLGFLLPPLVLIITNEEKRTRFIYAMLIIGLFLLLSDITGFLINLVENPYGLVLSTVLGCTYCFLLTQTFRG